MQQLLLRSELAQPPDRKEIWGTLGQLTVGKAGGDNDLLADIFNCCSQPLLDYILKLFHTVWEENCVPSE